PYDGKHFDQDSFPTRRASDLSQGAPSARGRGTQASAAGSCSPTTQGPSRWLQSMAAPPLVKVIERSAQRGGEAPSQQVARTTRSDRKSTRLNSSHVKTSYAVI